MSPQGFHEPFSRKEELRRSLERCFLAISGANGVLVVFQLPTRAWKASGKSRRWFTVGK
jgi:hypothetical protein